MSVKDFILEIVLHFNQFNVLRVLSFLYLIKDFILIKKTRDF